MGLYMYEVAYTPESVAAQIKEPHDRLEAVKPALETMGVKIVVGGYPLGDYDVLIIVEAADDATVASVGLAVTAGGAVKSSRITRLLAVRNGSRPCARRKILSTGHPGKVHTVGSSIGL